MRWAKVLWHRHFFFEDDILQTEEYSPTLKKIVDIYIAMAEGGFENPAFDPDESHWDDDDDGNDDQGDETTSFIPGSASTPSPFGEQIEIKTMQATCG